MKNSPNTQEPGNTPLLILGLFFILRANWRDVDTTQYPFLILSTPVVRTATLKFMSNPSGFLVCRK